MRLIVYSDHKTTIILPAVSAHLEIQHPLVGIALLGVYTRGYSQPAVFVDMQCKNYNFAIVYLFHLL